MIQGLKIARTGPLVLEIPVSLEEVVERLYGIKQELFDLQDLLVGSAQDSYELVRLLSNRDGDASSGVVETTIVDPVPDNG